MANETIPPESDDARDAARYRWLAENAVIEFDAQHGRVRHDGKDPSSTKQPLDNAIDAAMRAIGALERAYYCPECGVMEDNWHLPTCSQSHSLVRRQEEPSA